MSHLNFWILAFSTNFVIIKVTCLVTLFDHKLQVFKKLAKTIFDNSKCKRRSLRWQCWMQLFGGFSNRLGFSLSFLFWRREEEGGREGQYSSSNRKRRVSARKANIAFWIMTPSNAATLQQPSSFGLDLLTAFYSFTHPFFSPWKIEIRK